MRHRTGTFSIQRSTRSIKSRIKGIGRIFPIMQIGMARRMGMFKRAGEAAKSPPRSSKIGTMEIRKIMASLETFPPSAAVSHCTNESVILSSSILLWLLFIYDGNNRFIRCCLYVHSNFYSPL